MDGSSAIDARQCISPCLIDGSVRLRPAGRRSATTSRFFDLPFARVGLLSSEAMLYREATRALARKGVELIAYPTAWRSYWHAALMLTERSAVNHVTFAAANREDWLFDALSTIVTTLCRIG